MTLQGDEQTMAETIFDVLEEEHEVQRTLIELVEETQGDSEGRRELFARLRTEALEHAAVEERVFYSRLLADEQSRDKAGHSIEEHNEAEAIFDELEEMDMSSPGWLLRFRTLAEALRHHVDEEEQEVFQVAGKVLSDADKTQLAREFREQKPASEDR